MASLGVEFYAPVSCAVPEMHCLVYWIQEKMVSVVKKNNVKDNDVEVGKESQVQFGRKLYAAIIAAIGEDTPNHV